MATLIKTDGTLTIVHPKASIGQKFTLNELQGYIGGYIELIYPTNGIIGVVNEEGRLLHLAPNEYANLATNYDLVGDVLICDDSEID